MTQDQAREIAIRELRAKGRDSFTFVALRAEVYEAADVLEAQANVEEKKAAFLEAALEWGAWYCDNFKGYFKSGDWSAEEKRMMEAYRALVECERERTT